MSLPRYLKEDPVMKRFPVLVSVLMLVLICLSVGPASGGGNRTLTQHSYLFINGYMDETKIYETDYGFKGQKLVVGTRGSGTVSRRQTIDFWSSNTSDESEMYFNEWGYFEYHPYSEGPSESDLKNALCAKNYDIGSVVSESYSSIRDLVKDTTIYQSENVSLYQINSYLHGTARIGARFVNKTSRTTNMLMSGLYVGEVNIREEIEAGENPPLTLPCA